MAKSNIRHHPKTTAIAHIEDCEAFPNDSVTLKQQKQAYLGIPLRSFDCGTCSVRPASFFLEVGRRQVIFSRRDRVRTARSHRQNLQENVNISVEWFDVDFVPVSLIPR